MQSNSQRFTATHIAKSHKPTHKPKLGKECACPTAPQTDERTTEKEQRRHNITYTQAGVSCFVGQESAKFIVRFFVGSSVVKIPACV